MSQSITRVLFVCAGNTCRSPMAEAYCRAQVAANGLAGLVACAGAGVSAQAGDPVSEPAMVVLTEHGLTCASVARPFSADDWTQFDMILTMDRRILKRIRRFRDAAGENQARAYLLLDFARGLNETEVFDPYGTPRYAESFTLIRAGVDGLLNHIQKASGA